jgi:hypothetical protein
MIYRWIDKPNGTKEDHWIDLISQDTVNGSSDDNWREASVKWDGCIQYNRFFNEPGPSKGENSHPQLEDGMHICDIDEEIAWLQALKAAAIKHFGEWPR